MGNNAFTAGVIPGGLKDKQEIKILICFLLDKVKKALDKNDITSILQIYGLANYFEVSQAFEEMVNNSNIEIDKENGGSYFVTPTGKMIVEELSTSLPVSVREKALKSAEIYLNRLKSERENKVIIQKNKWGYNVICKVSGGEFNMLELKLYAPDIQAASIIKNNFYRDPSGFYKNVMSFLTQNEDFS